MKNLQKKRWLFFGLIFLCVVPEARGQSAPASKLLNDASEFLKQSREEAALETYLKVLKKDESNFEALWHISLLYARIGYREESEKAMKKYYQESLSYAQKTIQQYPDSGKSHFVYAVANGRISDISGAGVRIEKSHIVKKHAEKAVDMLPEYAPAWHLLGLWHSKVANVGTAQKIAAGVFSEGLPEGASNDKAVAYIQKAIELNPEQALRFKLDLARHYHRAGDEDIAIEVLSDVVQMTPENELEQWNIARAEELLEELK